MKTIDDIEREIDERTRRLAEAFEAAKTRRAIPVTGQELALLEELCTPRLPSRPRPVPPSGAPEWAWIRC